MLHGSAPCSRDLKDRMIAWLGPILHEFFGGTEGALVYSTPGDWAAHPGTVGKPVPGGAIAIMDADGQQRPVGEIGLVYLRAPDTEQFIYFKAAEKTQASRRGDWFTMGDMGYVDRSGYLYLTGRDAGFKLPKSFDFVEALPRSSVGKVMRNDLRNQYWPSEG